VAPRLDCRTAFAAALLGALIGCGDGSGSSAPPTQAFPVPWQRTEAREPCDDAALLRQPFFGDLHVHTRASADAYIYGTRVGPRDAYAFARGDEIAVSDENEEPTRRARLERRLDFTAVTDHSEWFGEVQVCTTPGTPVYDEAICQVLRALDPPGEQFMATVRWLFPAGVSNPPPSLPFCETPGVDCDAAAVSVWQDMQAAAEEAYDRTAACTFTSFIAYEHTASFIGRHQHRNVIFRNEHVPPFAASQLETAAGGVPQGVWTAIEDGCLNAGTGCDAVIIPHNPNLSAGLQFVNPRDAADAQRRQDREPLVELHQQKGNSECRFDRLAGRGVGTEDELCTFEQLVAADQTPNRPPLPIDQYPARNMVRNALKDGLAYEQTLGANPFRFGFIGSTDTHNALAGNTEETLWEGSDGGNDSTAARQIGGARDSNPGGLAVVWAEENSRDAIFSALRRRETYATSGNRPLVRFFAGDLSDVRCGSADFVERGYQTGTPMGGEIGAVRGDASPRFAVLAAKDPGTRNNPGTDLQRVQIIKGWVDADGQTHERVVDVAGDPDNGAGVNPATCATVGRGARELCTVWEDPDFDRTERAFYYARVVENPVCRWSTVVCKAAGVDPFAADCAAQASAAGTAFADCCLTQDDEAFLSPTVQERAWTSPVWYKPEAIAAVAGGVEYGSRPGTDRLTLRVRLGQSPIEDGAQRDDLIVAVSDDDEIFRVVIPAGTLVQEGSAPRFTMPVGDDIDSLAVDLLPHGEALLTLQTADLDLSAADDVEHMVEVAVTVGSRRATHVRLWQAVGGHLRPVSGGTDA
jgi:Protein of unknown function (DUF3604)